MEFTDIHSHILPELDDGAQNIEESLYLARIASENGVKNIIATPHVGGRFPVLLKKEIEKKVEALNSVLGEQSIDITIYAGAENVVLPELSDWFDDGTLVTLAGSDYVLLDLPFNELPLYLPTLIFDLRLRGVTPILAHIERNTEIQRDINLVEPLINQGAVTQVNCTSFTGVLGAPSQKCALELLNKDLINVIASDSHSYGGRNPNFQEVLDIIEKKTDRIKAKQLFTEIPEKILNKAGG